MSKEINEKHSFLHSDCLYRFRIIRIVDFLDENGTGLTYCILPQEAEVEYEELYWQNCDREYLVEIKFDEHKNKIGFDVLEPIAMEAIVDEYQISEFSSVVKDDIKEFGDALETELKNCNFENLITDFIKEFKRELGHSE